MMTEFNSIAARRDFLKWCGLSAVPFIVPVNNTFSDSLPASKNVGKENSINFIFDGLAYSPEEYMTKLLKVNQTQPIAVDFYGNGGATRELEAAFAKLTAKEKAIFLPSGTMANQLAIKLLNEANTKAIVPENSHIFRDEADAAQAVHNKRLIPVGKGKAYFDLHDLKETIAYYDEGEVFKSGLKTIVIENPVRRADGALVPIRVIQEISEYCKKAGFKLHLDGARIHIASAYTNISVAEYASYFDTVYISLYKYLNAASGAMLCGEASLIEKLSHQIKILGGSLFQTWPSTAMALYHLDGIEDRWKEIIEKEEHFIKGLNRLEHIAVSKDEDGTNVYRLELDKEVDPRQLARTLYNEYNIWMGRADAQGILRLNINESLLRRDTEALIKAWKHGIERASH